MLTIRTSAISKIQQEFSDSFPFLKLEFYRQEHQTHIGSSGKSQLKENTLLELLNKGNDEFLVNENLTVALLEQMFLNKFGVYVLVFRKSGKSWLETTRTNDWTLKRQNQEGEELSLLNRN